MATALQCQPLATPTRRVFWTTQLESCIDATCGRFTCARPGLTINETEQGATFATNDWVRSTALNMLLTDARRRDTRCGHAPGTLNGHWSESFIEQSREIGSHVRYVDPKMSVRDAGLLIKAEVRSTLQKLIDYGIAVDISVEATYTGDGVFVMNIEIFGTVGDPTRIGLSAKRNENAWAWVS